MVHRLKLMCALSKPAAPLALSRTSSIRLRYGSSQAYSLMALMPVGVMTRGGKLAIEEHTRIRT